MYSVDLADAQASVVVNCKLEAALAWAGRGLEVFPLQPNSKHPTRTCTDWTRQATTDPAIIRMWWNAEPDNNIGSLTTDLIVPDIDVKNGKRGLETFMALGFDFDTLTTRTPTNGYHCYYRGLDHPVGQTPLGEGLDIRSHHGYCLAPGSTIDGVPYEVELDLPIAPFPEQLRSLLKAPRQRVDPKVANVDLDTPEIVEVVAHWLAHEAPVAVEGMNGDDTTYKVACRMRDFGVSEAAALDLFLDEYNARCEPPWSHDEARAKIENAYRYATGTPGSASPAAAFEGVVLVPPPARVMDTIAEHNGGPLLLLAEDTAAQRFADLHRGKLRFCHDAGHWYAWTGTHWQLNKEGCAFYLARILVRELAQNEDDRARTIAGKANFARNVECFARCDPALAVTAETWDRDPLLLGTPGGTVDLRTGVMRKSNPQDNITKVAAAIPAERADCPMWLRFLHQVTGGDLPMIRFLQQWVGYSLTGDTREHALMFVFGEGGNGKSVFVNVVAALMGDYAVTAAMETFTASRGTRHATELAMLRGARLVTANETEKGQAWAEARIKAVTGGDPITANFMRQDHFTFRPAFKLLVVGNHKPSLRSVDAANRRRFNLVPFTRSPAVPDLQLEEKLRAEAPGILRWAISGCLDWQQNGLVRPAIVTAATEEYFANQDRIGQWLEEECDIDPGNDRQTATSSDLYASWSHHCKQSGDAPGSRQEFSAELQQRGVLPGKGAKGARRYVGIALHRRIL